MPRRVPHPWSGQYFVRGVEGVVEGVVEGMECKLNRNPYWHLMPIRHFIVFSTVIPQKVAVVGKKVIPIIKAQ